MSPEQTEEVASARDKANIIAYMALGIAIVAVGLLGAYVYRSMKPLPIIKELQSAQGATAEDVQELERAVQGLTININAIEETVRRDRQAAVVLDLKRSLITIKEVRKQAPASLQPKIEAIEEQLVHLLDEVGSPSPRKRIEIRSVR